MAKKTRSAAREANETDREIELALAEADVAECRARLLEAEEDVREAQERAVEENNHYEHACAVYADLVAGRRKTRT